MIVRAPRPAESFTTFHNATIRDSDLTWKARGLLMYLLSMPVDWRADIRHLANESPDGKTAVSSGLQELEAAGYLVRTKYQDGNGHWVHDSWVYDFPQVSPESGNPILENPIPGNRPIEEEPREEVPIKEEPTGGPSLFSEPVDDTQEDGTAPTDDRRGFKELWDLYPRKHRRKEAEAAFRARINQGVPYADLHRATRHYAQHIAAQRDARGPDWSDRYVMHGASFYGPNERWMEYVDSPGPAPWSTARSVVDRNEELLSEARQKYAGGGQ